MSVAKRKYTTMSYQKATEAKKTAFFGKKADEVSVEECEERYWKIVEGAVGGTFEAEYGNDLPSDLYASGFPIDESGYGTSPWNLNNMHRNAGNLLRNLKGRVSGVNVPWLYLGSCFSTFCWHVEDCHLYSVNYHHVGSPKVWYGVPGNSHAKEAFEEVMKGKMPELFERQPDVLFHMNTMMSPGLLVQVPNLIIAHMSVYGNNH